MIRLARAGLLFVLLLNSAFGAYSPAPANAYLYFGWPRDGQKLSSARPFRIWFGLRHMGVAPKAAKHPYTGHHHLLIDTQLPPLDQRIPSNSNHLHYGAGQTETTLRLPPGKHTLQLLLGDHEHIPHKPPVYSRKITVIVK